MAQNLKILNGKEIKEILDMLRQQYGYTGKPDVVWMLSEKKQRLHLFAKDLVMFDTGTVLVDSMGLYAGTLYEQQLRLSIEGSQILGPECTKNILDLTREELTHWMMGEKITLSELTNPPSTPPEGFVLVRHGARFVGCGKVSGPPEDCVILNYIPKTRFVHARYD